MTTVTDAEAIVQAIIGTPNTILSQASYDALVAGIKAAEARARLEGAEVMREAAATHLTTNGHYDAGLALYALDPAAILSEHARRKAMDELIAGDADLATTPPVG